MLSGGVVANVKLNQRIRELAGVDKLFVHPNMGDGGCGTGAALLEFVGSPCLSQPLANVFLGPSYSDERSRRRAAHLAAALLEVHANRTEDRRR